jgi:hypothetical protein
VNNAARRNALGNDGKRELAEAIERVGTDPMLRVIVLTGAGETSIHQWRRSRGNVGLRTAGDAAEGPTLTHRACEAIRARRCR